MPNIIYHPFYSFRDTLILLYLIIKFLIELLRKNKGKFEPLHVAILGSKGAGKTTLWNKLQNDMSEMSYSPTDTTEINSFTISYEGKKIDIASTLDIGGDDLFVEDYEKLIVKDDTLVYFLVDLLRLEETRQEIAARLRKVSEIIKEKELDKCQVKILATNLKKYKDLGLESKYGTPLSYVKSKLGISKFAKLLKGLNDIILPIELTDDSQIAVIKSQIINVRK